MRRVFMVIATMSFLNLTALAAFVGYAWSKGWLERERVREAVGVLVNDEPAADADAADTSAGAVAAKDELPRRGPRVHEILRRSQAMDEQRGIEVERRERDIKNLWALLETRELELMRAMEKFEAEKERFELEREQLQKESGDSGLQMEVDTLAGIDPKSAKELLRQKDDADVARILMAMDERKRNKIVKQCKNSEERLWIGRILEKFHASPLGRGTIANQAEDLDAAP